MRYRDRFYIYSGCRGKCLGRECFGWNGMSEQRSCGGVSVEGGKEREWQELTGCGITLEVTEILEDDMLDVESAGVKGEGQRNSIHVPYGGKGEQEQNYGTYRRRG